MSDVPGPPTFDREISIKAVGGFTAGLVITLGAVFLLMQLMWSALEARHEAGAPDPPRLPEARKPHMPPAPRLQAEPRAEMAALRHREDERLGSYGWVDRPGGVAHIPIDEAMALQVERGWTP